MIDVIKKVQTPWWGAFLGFPIVYASDITFQRLSHSFWQRKLKKELREPFVADHITAEKFAEGGALTGFYAGLFAKLRKSLIPGEETRSLVYKRTLLDIGVGAPLGFALFLGYISYLDETTDRFGENFVNKMPVPFLASAIVIPSSQILLSQLKRPVARGGLRAFSSYILWTAICSAFH